MKYGLLGERLGHSFSKEIHEQISNYQYEITEVPFDKFDEFMTKHDFIAINVTIPYKEKVIPYLDYIDDSAKKIGAVNTIVNKNGKLYGYNTDYLGLRDLVLTNNIEVKNKKVLVLGTGGTSKTSKAVFTDLGAKELVFVSIDPVGDEISYEDAKAELQEIALNKANISQELEKLKALNKTIGEKDRKQVSVDLMKVLKTEEILEAKKYLKSVISEILVSNDDVEVVLDIA